MTPIKVENRDIYQVTVADYYGSQVYALEPQDSSGRHGFYVKVDEQTKVGDYRIDNITLSEVSGELVIDRTWERENDETPWQVTTIARFNGELVYEAHAITKNVRLPEKYRRASE